MQYAPMQVGKDMFVCWMCKCMDLLCKRISETVKVREPGKHQSGREMYFSYIKKNFFYNNNKT